MVLVFNIIFEIEKMSIMSFGDIPTTTATSEMELFGDIA